MTNQSNEETLKSEKNEESQSSAQPSEEHRQSLPYPVAEIKEQVESAKRAMSLLKDGGLPEYVKQQTAVASAHARIAQAMDAVNSWSMINWE